MPPLGEEAGIYAGKASLSRRLNFRRRPKLTLKRDPSEMTKASHCEAFCLDYRRYSGFYGVGLVLGGVLSRLTEQTEGL
jgi:hypothetical protein